MLQRMLKEAFEGKMGVFREPFVYGFTARSREARGDATRPVVEDQAVTRDPLADVNLTESAIFVTAELPGVRSEELRVRVDQGKLVIRSEGDRRFFTSVDLPSDVDRDTLKYTFTNDVLDIVIARHRSFVTL